MDKIIKLEEAGQLALAIAGLYYQPIQFSWWMWPIIFLLPDIGMIGYTANPEVGAVIYNLVHHKLVALIMLGIGWHFQLPYITLTGLVLYGHSSMDRMFGYGLKYFDAFKHTHLGWM